MRDKGRWYVMLHGPTDHVPAVVSGLVEEISFYDSFPPGSPKREAGIYRHASAEAELQPYYDGKNNRNQVRIKAKKMEDVLELFRSIKIGSIRPEESYEGQQNGMSRAELEAELKQLKEEQNSFRSDRAKNYALGYLACVLRGQSWPFCTKSGVANKISEILSQ